MPEHDHNTGEKPEDSHKEGITSKIKYNKGYIVLLIIILGLGHVLDEYSSLAPGMIKSSMIDEFFVSIGWKTQDEALQFMNLLGMSTMVLMIAATLFKSLQDRIGRRIIFIISAIGMVLGVMVMILSRGYWIYFAGSSVMTFFIFNDMQYIYIQEETPARKRAQFFSYTKILGLAGLLLVPLVRSFTVVEGSENWRPVLYPPLIIGAIVIVLSLLFLKETRAYQIMKQEREDKATQTGEEVEKLSMGQAFKAIRLMPGWNQVKWLIILSGLFIFATLNQGYSEVFMDQAGVSLANRNIVLTISTVFVGVAYFVNGLVTDRIGRKASMVINAVATIVMLVVEYFAMWTAPGHSSEMVLLVIAGISQGYRIGSFWNITDVHRMMMYENTPTHLRGNVQAFSGLILMGIMIPSIFLINGLISAFPGNIQAVLLSVGIPASVFVIVGTIFKLKETVDVDITTIEA
ncbi:MAG: MFS transporter [Chloroflexota bacterium]